METRKCEICDDVLEIKKDRIKKSGKGGYTEISYSEEGVYFEDGGVWFCNKHWHEMTKDIFPNLKAENKNGS